MRTWMIAGCSMARLLNRRLNWRQCHRHCTTTLRKQLYSPIMFCSPGAATAPCSTCWAEAWADLGSWDGVGFDWSSDACSTGQGLISHSSPLSCSPHVPAASPVRWSHDNCEEVLDDWPKHMAHSSVLSPIVENYKDVAARASVDPIIVHGNRNILLLTWMAACMSSSSWRTCAAAAELFFASAGVGPAPRSAASSATTLDQPTGPAWNRFGYTMLFLHATTLLARQCCCVCGALLRFRCGGPCARVCRVTRHDLGPAYGLSKESRLLHHATCLAWSVSKLNKQSKP